MEFYKRRPLLAPVVGASFYQTVVIGSQVVSAALVAGEIYRFTTSTPCLIRQSSDSTAASLANGSMLVAPGDVVYIEGSSGSALTVIRAAVDGFCTLQRMKFLNSEG
jgi:hypothetical protein